MDLLVDGARGEGAGDPAQVQGFKRDKDHADVLPEVSVALWVDKVMRRFASDVLLKTDRWGFVHSLVEREGGGKEKGGNRSTLAMQCGS